MESGLSAITGGYGKGWMQKNLNGADINVISQSRANSLPSFLQGNNFALKSQINIQPGFENSQWDSPGFRVDTNIAHELGHVVDNRSEKYGLGSFSGGGSGDELMQIVGGKPKGWGLITGLRFLPNSLSIPRENAFGRSNGWGYGNNGPADYFAHAFAGTIFNQNDPNLTTYSCDVDDQLY